jgi:hypothetical protein
MFLVSSPGKISFKSELTAGHLLGVAADQFQFAVQPQQLPSNVCATDSGLYVSD